MRRRFAIAALAIAAPSGAAGPAGMVVAAHPQSIVDALQAAGCKALLGRDMNGDPKVSSAAAGANFSIYFHGCTAARDCQSLRFAADHAVKPRLAPERIDGWNVTRRFGKARLGKGGDPHIDFDVGTDGGLPGEAFAAALDRRVATMGGFQTCTGW